MLSKKSLLKTAAVISMTALPFAGFLSFQSCTADNDSTGKILFLILCMSGKCPTDPKLPNAPGGGNTYSCPAGCSEGSCIAGTFMGGATGECFRTSSCLSCGPLMPNGGGVSGGVPIPFGLTVTESSSPDIVAVVPSSGSVLEQTGSIKLQFNRQMDAASVDVVGAMAAEAKAVSFAKTTVINDTITIRPNASWSTGTGRTMRVLIKDVDGNSIYTDLQYTISDPAPPPSDGIPPWALCLFTNVC